MFAGKSPEYVVATFAASLAGGVIVPVNGLLKPEQVGYILRDCGVSYLITTTVKYRSLKPVLETCPDIRHVIVLDEPSASKFEDEHSPHQLSELAKSGHNQAPNCPRAIASDVAAIMYTSGSTGKPKGVVLSHSNLTIGTQSVAGYIGNNEQDRILAVLPFSFDAGFSQLTTGLYTGACIVLHDHLLARDIVRIVDREKVTGITGVPPLWMQIAEQKWPGDSADSVRYIANTGGKMPRETLTQLRSIFKNADPYLMYGLTESFRSTYLPPAELDNRPDSIGKAVPGVEVLIVDDEGKPCANGVPGELVHRGPLVSLGYWNDPQRTAERFRPAPGQPEGIPTPELAVWSGDTVRSDEEGYLYFVGRRDEMIKTSGYRVSPTEIEEVAFESGFILEAAALGIPHGKLGQAILLVVKTEETEEMTASNLLAEYRKKVPNYMIPMAILSRESLPRNANGKLDRKQMTSEFIDYFNEDLNS